MANTETQKKNKNRDAIIETARHVFNKYGYDKTLMEHIAKAVGKVKVPFIIILKVRSRFFSRLF